MFSISSVDKYGVRNFNLGVVFFLATAAYGAMCCLFAIPMYLLEGGMKGSAIHSYGDAVWLIYEASSSVGFGEITPLTLWGRIITGASIVPGLAFLGILAGVISDKVKKYMDNSIENRELRSQNAELLVLLKQSIKQDSDTLHKTVELEQQIKKLTQIVIDQNQK